MTLSVLDGTLYLFATLSALTVWHFIRPYVIKSPLAVIPGPLSPSLMFGNFKQLMNKDGWKFHFDLQEKYEGLVRLRGLLGGEILYVKDPLAMHHIFVKEAYVYDETQAFLWSNRLVFGKGLLSTTGDEHKQQRKMLNPVFSMKHMREMIPILYPITHKLRECLKREVQSGKEVIDIMSWASRAALEYIGQGGLGHSFSAFEEGQDGDKYSQAAKAVVPLVFKLNWMRYLLPYVAKLGPAKFRRYMIDLIPLSTPKQIRALSDTFESASKEILAQKREALLEGGKAVEALAGKGKDIMSILLKANEGSGMPEDELLGHMTTLIVAATDTTTSAITRILSLLVVHQDVQTKLREEVTAARKEHGDLDYDTLQALPFLDAVCRETLRVYCPVPTIQRYTVQDTVLPLAWPIKTVDGKSEVKEVTVPKGTLVFNSIWAVNTSKDIWGEDAREWKPTRWLQPLPESVSKARLPGVYSQMMTFIGGGRACIGFKFSEMEMKLVLSVLLETFIFEPGPEIEWAMSNVVAPYVKGSSDGVAQLPVKVRLVSEQ